MLTNANILAGEMRTSADIFKGEMLRNAKFFKGKTYENSLKPNIKKYLDLRVEWLQMVTIYLSR